MQKNPYLILGVDENATFAELQDAYEKLQSQYKSDRFLEGEAGANAVKKLEELEWAYQECQRLIQEKATVKDSVNIYEQIGSLIKDGKLVEAQSKLDSIEYRDANWHYYQSIVFYKKNWLSDSRTQLEICVNLEPNNPKYTEALKKLKQDMASSDPFANQAQQQNGPNPQQNRGGYTQPEYTNTQRNADACCNTCCTLTCCDTCCECFGGDLCSCC